MAKMTEELLLPPGKLISRNGRKGLCIECLAGQLWITSENETSDIILLAGQRHSISRNGLVLIEALASSQVRLNQTRQQSLAFRIASAMRLRQILQPE